MMWLKAQVDHALRRPDLNEAFRWLRWSIVLDVSVDRVSKRLVDRGFS